MEMRKTLFAISLQFFCWFLSADGEEDSKSLARGFNDNIEWRSLDDGLMQVAEQNKPGMILIHKTWCGACKALKPRFAKNKEIEELSKYFIMINVQDGEEPSAKQYFPDGGYIPRILFTDTSGNVRTDIVNPSPHSDTYKYYYGDPSTIVAAMKQVVEESANQKAGFDEL
ncbi:hypothetical protein CAPTEDRAFT_162540 [Capitella teleta]|uniref:Thioredoxin domain-containing protein n=1 Tax=Capitella teleta TaxID=283909 RepID=R7UL02_CAPTE|nr:hypothetical protein CAPTEDRAFT_162540 [Capitella teleta]|eukprot:ELU04453.1 hypothetical protein CAPTEDRAFT_162540 [Capitella teleta]